MQAQYVRELGMDPDEFWKLSFYNLSLWAGRVINIIEQRNNDRKLLIDLERNSMALLANIHSTKKYRPEDFWLLPTDVQPKVSGMSDEELMKHVKQRFKRFMKNA